MNILKNKVFWIVSGAVLLVAILGIVLFAVLSGGDSDNTYTAETAQQDALADEIYEANKKCVEYETGKRHHGTAFDTVEVTVTMPDYTKLYKEVYRYDNPEQELLKRLKSKDYEEITVKEMAKVVEIDGGEEVLVEECVEQLIEAELIKATNAVWEAEQ